MLASLLRGELIRELPNGTYAPPTMSQAIKLRSYRRRSASSFGINVRFWHKADIEFDAEHVRFRGQSGHL